MSIKNLLKRLFVQPELKPEPARRLFLTFAEVIRLWPWDPFKWDSYIGGGLFYFRSPRSVVMDPKRAVALLKERRQNIRAEYVQQIMPRLLKADRDGRILWPDEKLGNSFAALDKFLSSKGYPHMPANLLRGQYSEADVVRWIRDSKIDLKVRFDVYLPDEG